MDLIVKIVNDYKFKSALSNSMNGTMTDDIISHDQSLNLYLQSNIRSGQAVLSTNAIFMDGVLSVIIVLFYVVQTALSTTNYLFIGIFMMGRAYLKVPMSIALIHHHRCLEKNAGQVGAVHPKDEVVIQFSSYKEKVLYIIKKIRKQFGKQISMR